MNILIRYQFCFNINSKIGETADVMNSFRFNARNIFLTYPRCTLSKEEVLQALQDKFDVESYTIARELHQDGTPHLHCYITFSAKIDTRDSRAFDVVGFHPNIKKVNKGQAARNIQAYTQKGGDYVTNRDEVLGKRAMLFKSLQEEGDLSSTFVRKHPEIMAYNPSSLRQWLSIIRPPRQVLESSQKRRHIWLHGPSNTGKTVWLRAYRMLSEAVEIPDNDDWCMIRPTTDVVYKDEFKGGLSVQKLNRVCDGDCQLNVKGGSTFLGLVVVVIVSNYSILQTYAQVTDQIRDTLYNRFVEYDSSVNLPKLPFMPINRFVR